MDGRSIMKRLLLILGLVFIPSLAQANILDLPSYQSGADVTISNLQLTNTTTENWANGNVEGGGINIKPGSINTIDLAAAVSPVNRWDDSFNDYTVSGMLPVTDSDLTSDISAGVSYVAGYRIVTSATSHTYTASKDTYVYINKGGYFNFSVNNNGSTSDGNPPSPSADNLLLAKVITDATTISSVTDSRTLSIQITTTTTNFPSNFRDQAFVSRDSTTTMHIEPGSVAIGNTIYSRTADTSTKSLATGSNWIEGSVPATNGRIFLFAYNDSGSSWDFKYSTADVAFSDTSGNSNGVLKYYTTGGVYYRAIGWAYKSADAVQTYHHSNFCEMGIQNTVEFNSTTPSASTSSTSLVNDYGVPLLQFYSSGNRPIRIQYNAGTGNGSSASTTVGIMIDGVDIVSSQRDSGLSGVSGGKMISVASWQGILPRGIHTFQARFCALSAGTSTVDYRSITIEEV